ncbi:MAG: hypothetical protein WCO10_03835 [bacterium]
MKIKEQTDNFLQTLKTQREAGLVVLANNKDFAEVEESLVENKFVQAKDWRQILKQLSASQPTFMYINGEFTKECYDLLKQYSERGGMVQIMNPATMNYETVSFDPFQAQLVFLVTKEALGWAEEKYSLRDKAGLMEIIS